MPRTAEEAVTLRKDAEHYWQQLDLPYDCLHIPDRGIQDIIEASLRCIYQNRDYKNGVPVYQVGPTIYRNMSCADDPSFANSACSSAGRRIPPTCSIIFSPSSAVNGRLWVYSDFWKENGLVTWDLVRYAELTGDTAWLERRWKHVEGMVAFIQELRRRSKQNPNALNYGLMPNGFSDGGDAGLVAEYTNVLWNIVGLRAAIAGAKLLGKNEQAAAWQKEFDEMDGYFRKAINRDQRRDKHGNLYLPNLMGSDGKRTPAQGQWAFLHSVFPGKLYERNDPLVQGSLAMLDAEQVEGLPLGSGWVTDGVSALLQPLAGECGTLERSRSESRTLALCRRQPCSPRAQLVGGAIAPRRHCGKRRYAAQLGFRRVRPTGEVHARAGTRAGVASLRGIAGRVDAARHGHAHERRAHRIRADLVLVLAVSTDSKQAELKLDVPQRIRPAKVIVHLDRWLGRSGTIELPTDHHVDRVIEIDR